MLTLDLASKSLAFHYVAHQPVKLGPPEPYPDPGSRSTSDAAQHVPINHPRLINQFEGGRQIIPFILNMRLTTNTGAVFGLGKGGQWFFVVISVAATGFIVHVFRRSQPGQVLLHLSLGCIMAGALGNLYDRLRHGAVRDFLYLFPGVKLPFGLRWPQGDDRLYPWIFNVADASLLVGVGVLLLLMWRAERHRASPSRREPPPPSPGTTPG